MWRACRGILHSLQNKIIPAFAQNERTNLGDTVLSGASQPRAEGHGQGEPTQVRSLKQSSSQKQGQVLEVGSPEEGRQEWGSA